MLLRNYSADGKFLRLFLPAFVRVTWRALWFMNLRQRLVLLRMSLRRMLVWLPHRIRQWRDGVKMPVTLAIVDDVGCKARCTHCLFTAFTDRKARLGLDDLDRVLDQALAMNTTQVYMVGADPFYRDDVDGFLDVLAQHRHQLFLLFTEGQRVTEAHLDRIRRAGNIVPVLNIDGMAEATERRKGEGSFARLDDLLAAVQKRRMLIGVSAMVSTANLDEVTSEPFVRYLDERGAYFLAYIPYSPVDLREERHLVLGEEGRDRLFDRSQRLNRVARGLVVFDMLGIEQQLTSCPAAMYTMAVYHDGTVTPCLAVGAGHAESNVRERPLRDIFLNDPLYRAIRQRHADQACANRASGRRDKVHCMFFTDKTFLRDYVREHRDEIRVLAPYVTDVLEDEGDA